MVIMSGQRVSRRVFGGTVGEKPGDWNVEFSAVIGMMSHGVMFRYCRDRVVPFAETSHCAVLETVARLAG